MQLQQSSTCLDNRLFIKLLTYYIKKTNLLKELDNKFYYFFLFATKQNRSKTDFNIIICFFGKRKKTQTSGNRDLPNVLCLFVQMS